MEQPPRPRAEAAWRGRQGHGRPTTTEGSVVLRSAAVAAMAQGRGQMRARVRVRARMSGSGPAGQAGGHEAAEDQTRLAGVAAAVGLRGQTGSVRVQRQPQQ